MAIQQRVEVPEPFSEPSAPLWHPGEGMAREMPEGQPVPSPSDSDRYVTVDERVENTIGVVFASWPVVDAYGLLFPGQPEAAWFDAGDLQSTIDAFRDEAGEMLRPLRIGDTFWVRGFSAESPSEWEALRDITPQARTMTKAAVAVAALGAVAPPVDDLDLAADEEPPDLAAAPVAQMPGGPATARPTI
jgi:hypothetical protein